MNEIKREPIELSEGQQQELSIRLVQSEPVFEDLVPRYAFEFDGRAQSPDANEMYSGMIEFLRTNPEISYAENISSMRDYQEGFKRAIALVHLWIDSIYV